jgi:hypothetical protein
VTLYATIYAFRSKKVEVLPGAKSEGDLKKRRNWNVEISADALQVTPLLSSVERMNHPDFLGELYRVNDAERISGCTKVISLFARREDRLPERIHQARDRRREALLAQGFWQRYG